MAPARLGMCLTSGTGTRVKPRSVGRTFPSRFRPQSTSEALERGRRSRGPRNPGRVGRVQSGIDRGQGMKGMQKISRGAGFRGALDYAQDRDSPEAERGVLIGGNMSGQDAKTLASEFGLSRALRPDIEKPVWHNALRLPAGERITPDKFVQVADDYMTRMGFSDQHQRCYWLHDDAEGQHIHIVASRVGLDGSVYLGKNENLKSTRHIAALEEAHGLRMTQGVKLDADGRVVMPDQAKPTKGEIEMA